MSIPVFIFTPKQIVNNPYKSDNAIQFMVESLKDLEKEIGFMIYMGKQDDIIENLIKNDNDIKCVAINRDWTPYARKRRLRNRKVCSKYEVNFFNIMKIIHFIKWVLLLKDDRTPYKVYSDSLNNCIKFHER